MTRRFGLCLLLISVALPVMLSANQRTSGQVRTDLEHALALRAEATPDGSGGPTTSVTIAVTQEAAPARVVTDGPSLTAALLRGGTIQLTPGTYSGTFVIAVEGTELRGIAVTGGRVAAGATAAVTLSKPGAAAPVLTITASRVRVSGVTIIESTPTQAAVLIGSTTASDPLLQPDDVTLDHVELLATPTGGKRGVYANSRAFTLQASRVIGFWYLGSDAQGVLIGNGPGPHRLIDNEIQGSAENVMFGGVSIRSAAMIPSDGVLQGNLFLKPAEWRQKAGTVKTNVEIKAGQRLRIENNTLDGCWKDAQNGDCFTLTPRNGGNDSPWVVVSDITIRHNVVRNHTGAFFANIQGMDNAAPTQQTANITIEQNYGDSPNGIQVLRGVAGFLRVTRNTWPKITGRLLTFDGTQVLTPLTFTANVAATGYYGIQAPLGNGPAAFPIYTVNAVFTGNVLERWPSGRTNWPPGNTLLQPGALAALLDADGHYVPGGAGY